MPDSQSITAPGEREIFMEALDHENPEDRLCFLERACSSRGALRARVDAMLADHHSPDTFMAAPAAGEPSMSPSPTEQPGDRIGRYKLLEKIGEGGCGMVYMAEQEEPVHRRVALKVIKPGMDTKSVIARFEAERQALAMMDHPNIAKILDGGVTGKTEVGNQMSEVSPEPGIRSLRTEVRSRNFDATSDFRPPTSVPAPTSVLRPLTSDPGRPYFVMELVRGIRITDYCKQHNLSTRERLDLFTAVCSAVQHAHQKGIIHRDLKPSNILVTELDGRPVPKVIDFGIAKATEQKLTDKTLFTQFAQFVGTPAYMSPEQAAMSGADIDTRSDIYSLGVLLYELLTGTPPFDAQELLHAGFDEMRRIIRETEPPKPSTRLTQSARVPAKPSESPSEVGGRMSEIGGLKSDIRDPQSAIESDLDWIVMKCLEKDRTRRYETASGLAADIQRHLSSEPVTARPASAAYRFRKMVRRNKVTFAAASAVLVALIAGLGVSTWMFFKASAAEKAQSQERQKAEAEAGKSRQIAKFLQNMLKGVGPSAALGRDTAMLREILDNTADQVGENLQDQPEVEAELRTIIGDVYSKLGEYAKASAMLREALAITKGLRGNEHREVVTLLNAQAQVLGQQGELDQAEAMLREALAMERKLMGKDGDVTTSLNNLGVALADRGKYSEAETVNREVLALTKKIMGNEHEDVATSLNNLGVVLQQLQKPGDAETALREALVIQKKRWGNDHPSVATTLNNLANVVQMQNKLADSESLFRKVVALQRKLLGDAHPNVAAGLNGLALALLKQDRAAEAEPLLREGVEIERKARNTAHPQTARLIGNLGRIMEGQRKFDEAESLYREALAMYGKLPGEEHPDMTSWRNQLHNLLQAQGKPTESGKAETKPDAGTNAVPLKP